LLGIVLLLLVAGPALGAGERLETTRRTIEVGGRKIEADAGRLLVAENRAVSSSRRIPIRFLRLHSTAAKPRPPLFYLAGGPGDHGVTENPDALALWARFLATSDVVLLDQRGVGDPDLRWGWDGPPPTSFFLDADSARSHYAEMRRRAGAAFRARGVDLAGYTTVESAADVDELREALGAPRISLFAFSYGTHLACAYLKRFGDRVEDVVMIGLEGPDQTWKLPWTMDVQLRKLALLAAQDPRISKDVPDLIALFDRVVARLAREPMRIPVPAPSGTDTLRVPVGPFGLRLILRIDVGDATDLPVFPRLLWSIDHGDPSVLAWFLRKRAGFGMGLLGMNEAMDLASGVTRGRRALIEDQATTSRFADVVNFPYGKEDPSWLVPDLGDGFRSPVVTNARILLVSGSLDFNTPPSQSEEFRWGAANATHLVVENAGHEQTFLQNDTALPVVLDFLAGKDVRDRKITYPPLRFVPLTGTDPNVTHPSVTR
jgi:pimeloyl-ACP methyl ester carboxylesterase